METKDPGYYRMLLENIENAAPVAEADGTMEKADLEEGHARTIALARGLKRDVERALASQDPSERERLLHGVRNSMDDLIDAIRQGGMNEGAAHPALADLARRAVGPRGIPSNELGGDEREDIAAVARGTATGAQRARAADTLAKFYSNDRAFGPSSSAPARLPGVS